MQCITEKRDVICAWLKDGNYKISNNRFIYSQRSSNGDCSLIIHNLTFPNDNGIYECQVPSADVDPKFKWPSTKIVVLVKPSPPKFIQVSSVEQFHHLIKIIFELEYQQFGNTS